MMRPLYGDTGCVDCRFIDHFVGIDWYLCPIGPGPNVVARHSAAPHDITVRPVAGTPKVGMWHRAVVLAAQKGLIP
jgi:hypothetical protein